MASFKTHKTALLTGAGQRIGRAIALKLASMGYSIAAHYNQSQKEAEELARDVRALKQKAETFQCNLFDSDAVSTLINSVRKKFPGLSLLVNNASIFEKSEFPTSSVKNLERYLAVHLKAPYILTQEFARLCKSGSIINILDTHISDNTTNHFDYLLSKKALAEFTKQAAVALAPKIRVNGIAPGLILPPAQEKANYLNRLAQKIPLKRKGDIKNITQAVEFLATSGYVTGQILFVDGGEHLI